MKEGAALPLGVGRAVRAARAAGSQAPKLVARNAPPSPSAFTRLRQLPPTTAHDVSLAVQGALALSLALSAA